MKSISLNRLLVLEELIQTPDGAGGFSKSWVPVGNLWAEIRPGVGREAGGEEVTLAAVSYRITVRGAEQGAVRRPRPDQRLREGARVFKVLAVTERDPQGHYLTCFAREEMPA
jgi:head-tail adaptor